MTPISPNTISKSQMNLPKISSKSNVMNQTILIQQKSALVVKNTASNSKKNASIQTINTHFHQASNICHVNRGFLKITRQNLAFNVLIIAFCANLSLSVSYVDQSLLWIILKNVLAVSCKLKDVNSAFFIRIF